MGDIAPAVAADLREHGLSVAEMPFPQETLRDEAGYRRELRKVLESIAPRVVMPVGCQIAAARCRDILPEGTILTADSAQNIGMLEGKVSASAIAARLGIPQPRIYTSVDDISSWPVIFKKDGSFGGRGVRKPTDRAALERILEHEAASGKCYLIEEYVPGCDLSIDIVRGADGCGGQGNVRWSCYRSLGSNGLGPSTGRQVLSPDDPLCAEMARCATAILDSIDYRGICGMDFRLAYDGGGSSGNAGRPAADSRLLFLECNPRFTGGLASQLSAGFDLPLLLLQAFANE